MIVDSFSSIVHIAYQHILTEMTKTFGPIIAAFQHISQTCLSNLRSLFIVTLRTFTSLLSNMLQPSTEMLFLLNFDTELYIVICQFDKVVDI